MTSFFVTEWSRSWAIRKGRKLFSAPLRWPASAVVIVIAVVVVIVAAVVVALIVSAAVVVVVAVIVAAVIVAAVVVAISLAERRYGGVAKLPFVRPKAPLNCELGG